jgi:zinc/manganese transport system permease protein
MNEIIALMLAPFCECLVLVGIHSYLGLHVIRRGIIFVDLAFAQIAALGLTVGFLFGIMPDSIGAYWISLSFTLIGAFLFSLFRSVESKIPQEAIIGLVYAIAASAMIIVIDRAPHGAEHIKEIMTGDLLFVKWDFVISAAVVYSVIGIFHYIFRDKFVALTENHSKAGQSTLWDFLFYASFGVIITHSVRTAGVLLVFVFLVAPAIFTKLFWTGWRDQLIAGWLMGTLVSAGGLFTSYYLDMPCGPAVILFYGAALLMAAAFYRYKFFIPVNSILDQIQGPTIKSKEIN